MKTYKVTSSDGTTYTVEAENKNKARKEIIKREGIELEKINKEEEIKVQKSNFIFLEQDDREWEGVTIGETPYELGEWGCTITALSMLTYWYGEYFSPNWIAKNLKYTPSGEIYWSSMNGKLPMNFVYRYYDYYADKIGKIKSIIDSKDNACVIRVPYGKYSHWLTAIGYDDNGIIAADPIDGTRCYPEKKYGKIDGFTEVTRA